MKLENVDPYCYIMIASLCMAIYRSNYMPEKTIAIVPQYKSTDQYSEPSITWLTYQSQKMNVPIQHALNGGEVTLNIDNK